MDFLFPVFNAQCAENKERITEKKPLWNQLNSSVFMDGS